MAIALLMLSADPARAGKVAPELVLDAAGPVIAVELAGERLRLRVDPGQWEAIELNPEVAGRLKLDWTAGRHLAVGRVTLWGSTAQAKLRYGGVVRPVIVAHHGRIAATDADGTIGPDLLPEPVIRWRRTGAPGWTDALVLPLDLASETGLTAAAPAVAGLRLRFTLEGTGSSATAAAGALLARDFDGHYAGAVRQEPIVLGVTRPVRPIRFARPLRLAGFLYADVLTRVADFRGANALPDEPGDASDIVIAVRETAQRAEPWVTIGPDRLSRCAEITYTAKPRSLTLRCAFDP